MPITADQFPSLFGIFCSLISAITSSCMIFILAKQQQQKKTLSISQKFGLRMSVCDIMLSFLILIQFMQELLKDLKYLEQNSNEEKYLIYVGQQWMIFSVIGNFTLLSYITKKSLNNKQEIIEKDYLIIGIAIHIFPLVLSLIVQLPVLLQQLSYHFIYNILIEIYAVLLLSVSIYCLQKTKQFLIMNRLEGMINLNLEISINVINYMLIYAYMQAIFWIIMGMWFFYKNLFQGSDTLQSILYSIQGLQGFLNFLVCHKTYERNEKLSKEYGEIYDRNKLSIKIRTQIIDSRMASRDMKNQESDISLFLNDDY